MAMEVSDEIAGLFFVLTGERFPDANEDKLRELAGVWRRAAAGLRQLHAGIGGAVARVRASFDGGAERAFAERMAPWVEGAGLVSTPSGGPVVTSGARRGGATGGATVATGTDGGLIGSAAILCDSLADFLDRLADDVEYVKLVIIYQLELLLFEIWLAYVTSPFTGGAMWGWLAAKFAIVRLLMKHLLGKLALQLMVAWVISSAFQLIVDVAAQATQFGMGTRDEWSTEHTSSAAQVAALGAGLSLFMGPVQQGIASVVNGVLGRILQKDIAKFAAVYATIQAQGIHESATDILFTLIKEGKLSDTAGGSFMAGMTSGGASVLGSFLGENSPAVLGLRNWLATLTAVPGTDSPPPVPNGGSPDDPFPADRSQGGPSPDGPSSGGSPDSPALMDTPVPPLDHPVLSADGPALMDSPVPPLDHPVLSPDAASNGPSPDGSPPTGGSTGNGPENVVRDIPDVDYGGPTRDDGSIVVDEWWENAEPPAGEVWPDASAPPRTVIDEWWEPPGSTAPGMTTAAIGDSGTPQPETGAHRPDTGGEQPIVSRGEQPVGAGETRPDLGDVPAQQPSTSYVDGRTPDLTHGQVPDPVQGEPDSRGAPPDGAAPGGGGPKPTIDTSVANPVHHNPSDSPVSPLSDEQPASAPASPVGPLPPPQPTPPSVPVTPQANPGRGTPTPTPDHTPLAPRVAATPSSSTGPIDRPATAVPDQRVGTPSRSDGTAAHRNGDEAPDRNQAAVAQPSRHEARMSEDGRPASPAGRRAPGHAHDHPNPPVASSGPHGRSRGPRDRHQPRGSGGYRDPGSAGRGRSPYQPNVPGVPPKQEHGHPVRPVPLSVEMGSASDVPAYRHLVESLRADQRDVQEDVKFDGFGVDLFGLRDAMPPPDFLDGHGYSNLPADRIVSLFRTVDMAAAAPRPTWEQTAPESLRAEPALVHVVRPAAGDRSRWAPRTNGELLPELLEMPRVLHRIWLGGPLTGNGGHAAHRTMIGDAAKEFAGRLETVLWTDVPRERFERAAEHGDTLPEDDPLAPVQEMLRWARENNVRLVNVDELSNANRPLLGHDMAAVERAKQTPEGSAGASDVLRVAILHEYGGVYLDGDTILADPTYVDGVISSRAGYALDVDTVRHLYGNSALVAPRRHPFLRRYLDTMRENYGKSYGTLMDEAAPGTDENLRRRSIWSRVGPGNLDRVAQSIGHASGQDLPGLRGLSVGSLQTWMAPASVQHKIQASDEQATKELTKRVVQTLARGLANRDLTLPLTAVDAPVRSHERPDLIWNAAITYLVEHPDLGPLIWNALVGWRQKTGPSSYVELPPYVHRVLGWDKGTTAVLPDDHGEIKWEIDVDYRGERIPTEVSVFQGRDLTFADVDFVALPQGESGEEVGVAFPRSAREANTLRSAFEQGASSEVRKLFGVADGNREFSIAAHFDDGRFTVGDKSGVPHRLTEEQMVKLLLSAGRPGPSWNQRTSLVWLSCELGSLSNSGVSNGLRDLLEGQVGEQHAPRGRPELFATGGVRLNGDPAVIRLGEPESPHHENTQPSAEVWTGDSVQMASDTSSGEALGSRTSWGPSGSGGHGVGGWVFNMGAAERERALTVRYGTRIGPAPGENAPHFSHSLLDKIDKVWAGLPPGHVRGNDSLRGIIRDVRGKVASLYDPNTETINIVHPYRMPSWLYTRLSKGIGWQRRLMDRGAMSGYSGIDKDNDRALGIDNGARQVMAGVSDVLAHGNLVEWVLRHELAHSVDENIGWSQELAAEERFGGWQTYEGVEGRKRVAAAIFGKVGISAQEARTGLAEPWLVEGSSLLDAFGYAIGQVARTHPERLAGLPEKFDQGSQLRSKVEAAVRFARTALAQPWTMADGGGDAVTVGNRIYQVSPDEFPYESPYEPPYGPRVKWVSYRRAARQHAVSNYQFSDPKEWFAEAYAAFHDPRPEPRAQLRDEVREWFAAEAERNGGTPTPQETAPGGLVTGSPTFPPPDTAGPAAPRGASLDPSA